VRPWRRSSPGCGSGSAFERAGAARAALASLRSAHRPRRRGSGHRRLLRVSSRPARRPAGCRRGRAPDPRDVPILAAAGSLADSGSGGDRGEPLQPSEQSLVAMQHEPEIDVLVGRGGRWCRGLVGSPGGRKRRQRTFWRGSSAPAARPGLPLPSGQLVQIGAETLELRVVPLVHAVMQCERIGHPAIAGEVPDSLEGSDARLVRPQAAREFRKEIAESGGAPTSSPPGGGELVDGRIEMGPPEVFGPGGACGGGVTEPKAQVLVEDPAALAVQRRNICAVRERERRSSVGRALHDREAEPLLERGVEVVFPRFLQRLQPDLAGVSSTPAIEGEHPAAAGVARELSDEDVGVVVHLTRFVAGVDGGDRPVLLAREGDVEAGLQSGVHGLA
jgi:hypothetical protein